MGVRPNCGLHGKSAFANYAAMVALFALLGGCHADRYSLECAVPTYDLPKQKLSEVEARLLADMCTESWSKVWALKSHESAGDLADAVVAECASTYSAQAEATWPMEKWPPGTALEHLGEIAREWRGESVNQVVKTRASGCRKIEWLPKYAWVS